MLKHASLRSLFGNLLALSALVGCGGGSAAPTDVTFDVSGADVHPISPLIYGTDGADRPQREPLRPVALGRQPPDRLQLGEQRLQRRQRLQVPERRSPLDERHARRGAARDARRRARHRAPPRCSPSRSSTTWRPTRTAAATCATRAPTTCRRASSRTGRARAGALHHARPQRRLRLPGRVRELGQDDVGRRGGRRSSSRSITSPTSGRTPTPRSTRPRSATTSWCTRNITYATMVKSVWPEAEVTGFVSYGWRGYVTLQNAPDAAGKGDFIDYYLDKMKAAEAAAGKRLVDFLDLHWYPEAHGGNAAHHGTDTSGRRGGGARAGAALAVGPDLRRDQLDRHHVLAGSPSGSSRACATRSPPLPGHEARLHRVELRRRRAHPGAIAIADVLGHLRPRGGGAGQRLGAQRRRELHQRRLPGLSGTSTAPAPPSATPRSTPRSSDVATATVYASLDAANPDRVVIVAINKSTAARTAGIKVAHPTLFGRLKVHTITSAGAALPPPPTSPPRRRTPSTTRCRPCRCRCWRRARRPNEVGLRVGQRRHSSSRTPLPPISFGRSLCFGSPSGRRSTLSA